MEITEAIFDKMQKLSRLKIADDKKEKMRDEMQKMVGFVEKLNELNVDDVLPVHVMSKHCHPMNQDKVNNHLISEDSFKNSPAHSNHYFTVPKVIKQ